MEDTRTPDALDDPDPHLPQVTAGLEMFNRMETIERDIERRTREVVQSEKLAAQERAAIVELKRVKGEYARILDNLHGGK